MPLDFKTALIASAWAALRARAAIVAVFKLGNQHDIRTDGVARRRLAGNDPAALPKLDVDLDDDRQAIGTTQGHTTTPTFGAAQGSAMVDTIVPITVPMRIVAKFDADKLGGHAPPEMEIRAALMAGYPKLGLPYVRSFTIDERRERDNGKLTVTFKIVFELRLYSSQLQ